MCMTPNYYQKPGKLTFYHYHHITAFCSPSNILFTAGFALSYQMEFCPTTKFNVYMNSLSRLSKISYKNRLYGLSLKYQYLSFCLVCTYRVWKVCFYNTKIVPPQNGSTHILKSRQP